MYHKIVVIIFLFVCTAYSQVKLIDPVEYKATSFVIVVDNKTYNEICETINLYRDAVEDDGLSTYILISDWKDPRDVKSELIKLYNKKPKPEGMVLIGDIPIPMIRGAQHMTSAFKLDESRYDWFRSSVPSDRFYDDLDLEFEYLRQDTVNALCHHFLLKADSPQRVERELYSGRIKPAVNDDTKYDLIKKYLLKAIESKKQNNFLDNMLVFTGHGYYSEALDAWTDEHVSLREQFPQLFIPGNELQFLNFRMSRDMKNILMDKISVPKLDFAIFHAHGADEIQYILNYPAASMISQNVESIKMFLRSKMRGAKRRGRDLEKTKNYYKENYSVPDIWFKGAFADSVIKADSIFEHTLDIYSEDLKLFDPNAEVVMFDECFNGSFHEEGYIAGDYIFDDGATVVGIANSVNCLQDKWANKLIGSIGLGLRVGLWHQNLGYLENHIIGDPTFRFQSYLNTDLNKAVIKYDENDYRKLLASDKAPLRSLAIYKLAQILEESFDQELIRHYDSEISFVVRLQIINCLALSNGKALRQILTKSIYDPYEFIRRVSTTLMGKIGDPEFIPIIVERSFNDASRRVAFSAKRALDVMYQDSVMKYTKSFVDQMPDFYNKEELLKRRIASVERSEKWLNDEILGSLKNDSLSLKKKRNEIRTFRNYNFVDGVEPLTEYLKDSNNPDELRITAAEALGWFNYNYKRDLIIKACKEILIRENESEELLTEVLKTKKRLMTGANVPLTP
jgi:hypothetical protein